MKIGIDIREACTEKTGKGYYSAHLVEEILKQDKANEYILYSCCPTAIYRDYKNAKVEVISRKGIIWHTSTLNRAYKDNIDIYFSPTSYIIPALHNPKKLKVIMTIHDLIAFLFPGGHKKKAVFTEKMTLQKALKKTVKVLSVSRNTKKDLISRFKCGKKQIDIVPNAASDIFEPIPSDIYEYFVEEKNIPEKFIFSAGTLEPRKNYPTLIKSFAEVLKDHPDYHLLIAGGKGWNYEETINAAAKHGIEDKVRFLNYVPDRELVYLYNLATVFVWPSLYEGFGIPPLEAMQCGCPVITSNVSSLPEVVSKAAIQIDPKNTKQLTEAIIKVLSNKNLREDMIRKGFNQAKKYSWKKSAKKFLDILKEV